VFGPGKHIHLIYARKARRLPTALGLSGAPLKQVQALLKMINYPENFIKDKHTGLFWPAVGHEGKRFVTFTPGSATFKLIFD
jgi:hypothetical protein